MERDEGDEEEAEWLTSRDGSLLLPRNNLETSSIFALACNPCSKMFFWSVGGRTHVFSSVCITNFHSSLSNRLRTVLSQYWANSDNLPSNRSIRGANIWSASLATFWSVLSWAWFCAVPGPFICVKSALSSWTLFFIVGPRLRESKKAKSQQKKERGRKEKKSEWEIFYMKWKKGEKKIYLPLKSDSCALVHTRGRHVESFLWYCRLVDSLPSSEHCTEIIEHAVQWLLKFLQNGCCIWLQLQRERERKREREEEKDTKQEAPSKSEGINNWMVDQV